MNRKTDKMWEVNTALTLKWQFFLILHPPPPIFQHIKYCEAAYKTCMNNTENWKTNNSKDWLKGLIESY